MPLVVAHDGVGGAQVAAPPAGQGAAPRLRDSRGHFVPANVPPSGRFGDRHGGATASGACGSGGDPPRRCPHGCEVGVLPCSSRAWCQAPSPAPPGSAGTVPRVLPLPQNALRGWTCSLSPPAVFGGARSWPHPLPHSLLVQKNTPHCALHQPRVLLPVTPMPGSLSPPCHAPRHHHVTAHAMPHVTPYAIPMSHPTPYSVPHVTSPCHPPLSSPYNPHAMPHATTTPPQCYGPCHTPCHAPCHHHVPPHATTTPPPRYSPRHAPRHTPCHTSQAHAMPRVAPRATPTFCSSRTMMGMSCARSCSRQKRVRGVRMKTLVWP